MGRRAGQAGRIACTRFPSARVRSSPCPSASASWIGRSSTEADHYIDEYLGERASQLVDIPLSYLKRARQEGRVRRGGHVRSRSDRCTRFTRCSSSTIRPAPTFIAMWHNAVVTDRLWYTGSGAALVLALLGTFYGYLRLDLRTGGSHKGRLQLAATLVALIVAAGALLVRWAVPF